jgi:hypothetical protein
VGHLQRYAVYGNCEGGGAHFGWNGRSLDAGGGMEGGGKDKSSDEKRAKTRQAAGLLQ